MHYDLFDFKLSINIWRIKKQLKILTRILLMSLSSVIGGCSGSCDLKQWAGLAQISFLFIMFSKKFVREPERG